MIKDKPQKKLAARFCASQGLVPFVEVVVRSHTGLEEAPVNITDIDVLGIGASRYSYRTRILFDCKSTSKLSPINRCLWASGLRSYVEADRAFVIQKRDIAHSHRIAANAMMVHAHSEESFERYASSLDASFLLDFTYLDDMDKWDIFIDVPNRFPAMTDLVSYNGTFAALERAGAKGVRQAISALLKAAPEMDPEKDSHFFIYCATVSSFMIFLGQCLSELKDVFSFSMERDEFERVVRYYIWDGKDNFGVRKKMRELLLRSKSDAELNSNDFELPEWDKFLHLVRTCLDAPDAMLPLAYYAKEFAFRMISEPRFDPDLRLKNGLISNNRSRQFLFAAAAYLVSAGRLPKDFARKYEAALNGLMA